MSMFPFAGGTTVGHLKHQPGEVVDGYQTEDSWAEQEPIPGCAVAPGEVKEPFQANRDGVSVAYTVYAPPGTLVAAKDRLVIPGEAEPFEVVGPGSEWINPFTRVQSGVVIPVGRFDG